MLTREEIVRTDSIFWRQFLAIFLSWCYLSYNFCFIAGENWNNTGGERGGFRGRGGRGETLTELLTHPHVVIVWRPMSVYEVWWYIHIVGYLTNLFRAEQKLVCSKCSDLFRCLNHSPVYSLTWVNLVIIVLSCHPNFCVNAERNEKIPVKLPHWFRQIVMSTCRQGAIKLLVADIIGCKVRKVGCHSNFGIEADNLVDCTTNSSYTCWIMNLWLLWTQHFHISLST